MLILTIFAQFAFGPLGAAITRYSAEKDTENGSFWLTLRAIENILYLLQIIVFIVIVIILGWRAIYNEDIPGFIFMAGLSFAFSNGLFSLKNAELLGQGKQISISIRRIGEALTRLISGTFAAWYFESGTFVLIGMTLGTFVWCIPNKKLFIYHTYVNRCKMVVSIKKLFRFAFPFIIWGLFTGFLLVSDKYFIGIFNGDIELGRYAPIYQLSYTPIALLFAVYVQLLTPGLYQARRKPAGNRNSVEIKRYIFKASIISIFISIICGAMSLLLAEPIGQYFLSENYWRYLDIAPILVLSAGIFSAGQLMSLWFQVFEKTNKLINIKVTTAVFGVMCNALGSYYFGVSGVVIGILFFSLMYTLWMAIIVINDGDDSNAASTN
jgi:O-antigen/teichoic acid export membrane protein